MESYSENRIERNRVLYLSLALATIIAGLLSRSTNIELPVFIRKYAGDSLWGLMVFWLLCVLLRGSRTRKVAFWATVFAFSIEFSQFYHAPWIDSIRATRLGALVLGHGFKFSDLLCYSVGIAFGARIDRSIMRFLQSRR